MLTVEDNDNDDDEDEDGDEEKGKKTPTRSPIKDPFGDIELSPITVAEAAASGGVTPEESDDGSIDVVVEVDRVTPLKGADGITVDVDRVTPVKGSGKVRRGKGKR